MTKKVDAIMQVELLWKCPHCGEWQDAFSQVEGAIDFWESAPDFDKDVPAACNDCGEEFEIRICHQII